MEYLLENGDLNPLWDTLAEPNLDADDLLAVTCTAQEKGIMHIELRLEKILETPRAKGALKVYRRCFPQRELDALRKAIDQAPWNILEYEILGLRGLEYVVFRLLLLSDPAGPLLTEPQRRVRSSLGSRQELADRGVDEETAEEATGLLDWAVSLVARKHEKDEAEWEQRILRSMPLDRLRLRHLEEAGLPELPSGVRGLARRLRSRGFTCLEDVLRLSSVAARKGIVGSPGGSEAGAVDVE